MSEYIIKFDKEYNFENKTYKEINLSNIDKLTGLDLDKANKLYRKKSSNTSVLPEMDLTYCFIIAHLVTNLPVEFFENLPSKYCVKIRTIVMTYFFGSD